ncbi:MAG: hypothetical protein HY951_14260 [Bacteroidia bacterium]|nr:hypothetical protein [Bacteroidia bacterium]
MKRTEIIVNNSDSTVKAIILLKKTNLKPKNSFVYYWYNSDKIERNAGGYYGKLLDGKYFVFDKDRNLITQGIFKKGLKKGEWKTWNAKGGIRLIENMKNGYRNGKVIAINETGKIITTTNYRKGLRQGKCTIVSPDTTITKMYQKDKEIIKELKDTTVKVVDEKVSKEKKVKKENPQKDKNNSKVEENTKSDKPVKKPFWKKKDKNNAIETENNKTSNTNLEH